MLQMTISTLTTKTTQQKETIARLQEELEFLKEHTVDEQVKELLEEKAALTEQIQELTSQVPVVVHTHDVASIYTKINTRSALTAYSF